MQVEWDAKLWFINQDSWKNKIHSAMTGELYYFCSVRTGYLDNRPKVSEPPDLKLVTGSKVSLTTIALLTKVSMNTKQGMSLCCHGDS